MLTLGTGPEILPPIPSDFYVERLRELLASVTGAVAALDAQDATVPTLKSVAADLATAREVFEAMYSREHGAAARYVAMVEAEGKRRADHESAVRLAVESGQAPPSAGDGDLIHEILDGAKQARIDGFPLVEQAAQSYVKAAKVAAASRALLLVLTLRPIVESYQPTIDALHAAEDRASQVPGGLDGDSLLKQFKAEGLLKERVSP